MSEQSAFPLSWPVGWKRTKAPQYSRFDSPTVAKARDHILAELYRMGVPDYRVVISTNIPLRRDGLPYSNQKEPMDTGVAVYFTLNKSPKALACDKWRTVGENLWSIAKTIEATRGIERWGSVTMEQAFAGYTALPQKTEDSWPEVLGVAQAASMDEILLAYRTKAKTTHPDGGGSQEAFIRIQRAFENAKQFKAANG